MRSPNFFPPIVILALLIGGCGDSPPATSPTIPARASTPAVAPTLPEGGENSTEFDDPFQLTADEKAKLTQGDQPLTARDAEVIRHILEKEVGPDRDRINFVTLRPFAVWGDDGNWTDIPASLRDASPFIRDRFRPASEAVMDEDGHVREKSTGAAGWMHWVTIKRWISETEVEVEQGIWCCPLGGGGRTTAYQKVDGNWRRAGTSNSWVS